MNKFRFRLEAVERHRKLQEQEKQLQLARSLVDTTLPEDDLFAGIRGDGTREDAG